MERQLKEKDDRSARLQWNGRSGANQKLALTSNQVTLVVRSLSSPCTASTSPCTPGMHVLKTGQGKEGPAIQCGSPMPRS